MLLQSNGRLQALPANIRLRYKRVVVENTLAYYDPATITSVKRFIVEAKSQFVFTLFLQSKTYFSQMTSVHLRREPLLKGKAQYS